MRVFTVEISRTFLLTNFLSFFFADPRFENRSGKLDPGFKTRNPGFEKIDPDRKKTMDSTHREEALKNRT